MLLKAYLILPFLSLAFAASLVGNSVPLPGAIDEHAELANEYEADLGNKESKTELQLQQLNELAAHGSRESVRESEKEYDVGNGPESTEMLAVDQPPEVILQSSSGVKYENVTLADTEGGAAISSRTAMKVAGYANVTLNVKLNDSTLTESKEQVPVWVYFANDTSVYVTIRNVDVVGVTGSGSTVSNTSAPPPRISSAPIVIMKSLQAPNAAGIVASLVFGMLGVKATFVLAFLILEPSDLLLSGGEVSQTRMLSFARALPYTLTLTQGIANSVARFGLMDQGPRADHWRHVGIFACLAPACLILGVLIFGALCGWVVTKMRPSKPHETSSAGNPSQKSV